MHGGNAPACVGNHSVGGGERLQLEAFAISEGYPVGSGDNHDQNCSGDGWSYDGTNKVLTLAPENPTTYDLKAACLTQNSIACSIIIKEKATITDGNFYK